jgi:hypothetical protein
MKRSILFSAVLLTATCTFGQQSETVTETSAIEITTLDDTFHPQLTVHVPNQSTLITPVYDKIRDNGEKPKGVLNLVEEVKDRELAMEVYPNPNAGIFKIRLPETDQRIKAIEIFDLTGKIRYADTQFLLDKPLDKEIDISGFENGAYILRVILEDHVLVERIVKRN